MSERAAIRTSKKECVECWSKRIKETEVGTDWDLAEKRCWRCGKETELQRCHLIPDSLGGKDEASNIVLLCDKCHKEGPNAIIETSRDKMIAACTNTLITDDVVDIANGIFAGFSVFTDTYNKANQINPDSFKYY